MNELEPKESLARQYLLGELDEAGREEFEVRFISDPQFRAAALMDEDELVEDYVAGRLSASEREKLVRHYLTTPHQIQKLRITKALSERADEHFSPHPLSSASPVRQTFMRLRDFFNDLRVRKARKLLLVPVVLLALFVTAWLVASFLRNDARKALQQQLIEINGQTSNANGPRVTPSPFLVVTLAPPLVRDVVGVNSFSVPSGVAAVQLQLNGVGGEYSSYRAVLRSDQGEVFRLEDLKAQNTTGGRQIIINIPPKLLERRDYQLSLSGLTASGQYEEVADYNFRVAGTN
jgi:hypothetical protein